MKITILPLLHASPVSAISTAAGPRRLLDAGLPERLATDGHDVRVTEIGAPLPDRGGAIGREFSVAAAVSERVGAARADGRLPIVLSGSCHVGIGCVAGLDLGRSGVVWMDAHGDFNTPDTTESGLLDGMALATITGRCWSELGASLPGFQPVADERVLMLGVRDLDPGEAALLDDSAITVLASERIPTELEAELNELAERAAEVYVHLDLDVLDPSEGKANAFASPGGLSRTELCSALSAIRRTCGIGALALASYDPDADPESTVHETAVQAVQAAAGSESDPGPVSWLRGSADP